MYPDLQFFLEHVLGTNIPPFFAIFKTFGLFMAISFLAAGWLLKKELKRKEKEKLLNPENISYLKAKRFLPKKNILVNEEVKVPIYPHQRVGEIIMLAAIGGLIGAKIFNALETWDDFLQDPIESLFSGSGLTFYGGLIVAAGLIYYYCSVHKIAFVHFCDAIAPGLMLAYGFGRLGCHFSGDGDWGIFNSAYKSLPDGSIQTLSINEFDTVVRQAPRYFIENFGQLDNVPHSYAQAYNGLPTWLYAVNYTHNVNNEGVLIENCHGTYCHMLPIPVFPTSLYEAGICIILFFILWAFRKKFNYALQLFGLYLLLNGLERFLIEIIKVNYQYDFGFFKVPQSQLISVALIFLGVLCLIMRKQPIRQS